MDFDLVVADKCCACERVTEQLHTYTETKDYINFKISIQNLSNLKTSIVPSLFINGKLFAYGDIDFNLLEEKIRDLQASEIVI